MNPDNLIIWSVGLLTMSVGDDTVLPEPAKGGAGKRCG